jgi:hypothetical protein
MMMPQYRYEEYIEKTSWEESRQADYIHHHDDGAKKEKNKKGSVNLTKMNHQILWLSLSGLLEKKT